MKTFDDFYPFYKILPCSPFHIVRHSPTFPYKGEGKGREREGILGKGVPGEGKVFRKGREDCTGEGKGRLREGCIKGREGRERGAGCDIGPVA